MILCTYTLSSSKLRNKRGGDRWLPLSPHWSTPAKPVPSDFQWCPVTNGANFNGNAALPDLGFLEHGRATKSYRVLQFPPGLLHQQRMTHNVEAMAQTSTASPAQVQTLLYQVTCTTNPNESSCSTETFCVDPLSENCQQWMPRKPRARYCCMQGMSIHVGPVIKNMDPMNWYPNFGGWTKGRNLVLEW